MLLLPKRVATRPCRRLPDLLCRLAVLGGPSVLVGFVAACGADLSVPVPADLTLDPASVSFDALGQTQQLSPSVTDENGNALPESRVNWSTSNMAIASVTSTGLVTALGAGSAQVTATAGAASATAEVAVVQAPTLIQKVSGDDQTGTPGQALPDPLVVQVSDARGNPVSGVAVVFTAAPPGGLPTTPAVTTAADGRAATAFTTGTVAGTSQISATITATSLSVSFTATTTPGTPAAIVRAAGNDQQASPGTALAVDPAVLVTDANGNPVAGVAVVFEVTSGGGSVTGGSTATDAAGVAKVGSWTLGSDDGSNELRASAALAGINGNPITFTATAISTSSVPTSIAMAAGNDQEAAPGTTLPINPAVLVTDSRNRPVAGVPVVFEVISGGGSVTGGSAVTNAGGLAKVGSWTLGTAVGSNELHATAAPEGISGNPITFTATTITPAGEFNIEVRFLNTPTAHQRQAFTAARLRWESLITGDLEDGVVQSGAGECGADSPALNENVDDVLILVDLRPIDGPGGILGQAGPCLIRDPGDLTPGLGTMEFDTDDLDELESEGLLSQVIVHEMGHVLGFGTLWTTHDLLADAVSSGGSDPHFTGAEAITAFNGVGGAAYRDGAKVPVESFGEPGTFDAHWRESVFGDELMTGFINTGKNPLSKVTVASLQDLGFKVNLSKADAYTLAPALRIAGRGRSLHLENDVVRIPIKRMHPKSRGGR